MQPKFVKAGKVRNAKLRQLFLNVAGVRDIGVVESFFNDLKDLPISDISATNNYAKAIAFVVCYARIFNSSEGVGNLKTKEFLKSLVLKEEQMHKWLCDVRNELYAHVDPQHTEIYVNFNSKKGKHIATAQLSYHPFQMNKHITKSLLNKLRSYLEKKRDELAAELFKGKTNMQLIVYKDGFQEREVTDKG